jgi:transcriptional regulator with XRE-family HTH domain
MSTLRNGNVYHIIGGMGMKAVGGYLRGLREGRDWSAADVASRLHELLGRKIDPTTIWRIETDRQNPGGDLLIGLVSVLNGRMADVEALFRREGADALEGEALGRQVAAGNYEHLTPEEMDVLNRLSPGQRKAALALLRQMLQETR